MEGFLQRLRDLVERGRLDISQVRIADVMCWMLELARSRGDATLGDWCGALEAAARLALLKARRLNGAWQAAAEEDVAPWLGPPAELPLRRSWLADRFARGPFSFVAAARSYETITPTLAPVAPERLRAAMLAVLTRERRPPTIAAEPRPPRLSTEVCSARILQQLASDGEIRLHAIAGDDRDSHVAAFLSCLILARQGRVDLVQDQLFGDIIIRPAADALHATA